MAFIELASFIIKNSFSIITGIFGIGFIIAFHEFGHFIFGKLFGVNIPSFSIGFGPKLLTTKIGSTDFSISAVPLGGYVEAEVGNYNNPQPGTIAGIAYWKKMTIIGGGILFNLIFAYAVFVGLSLTGIPGNPFYTKGGVHAIEKVEPNSAAQQHGIIAGDKITAINGTNTKNDLRALLTIVKNIPNQKAEITVERDGKEYNIYAVIGSKTVKGKEIGSLGAQFSFAQTPPVDFRTALQQAFEMTVSLIKSTANGFLGALTKRSTDGLAGPLMMISMTAQTASHSVKLFLLLLGLISVSLAVLNLIPLPILDGGQAVTYTIEAIRQKPLSEQTLEYVHYTCWLLMLTLFVYLTFKDVIAMWF